jgi:nucleoside-diphosphate-sugar epimerase
MMTTVPDLEDALSTPTEADIECLRRVPGNIMILGAGGKMGPSLARLCRRAADAAGPVRRIFAVSRRAIKVPGVESIATDLLDRCAVGALPNSPNILYLAGRKFGSTGNPELTWAMNTLVPAIVAERFKGARIVVFSTGNVYPLRDPATGGSSEDEPPAPVGEYAQSCLGRERIFEHYSLTNGTRCVLFRLNYAVDLRYGVPVDIARKVVAGEPIDLTMPAFNAIWQRDANSHALRALDLCISPPRILNVTGPDILSVLDTARFFAARFGKPACFSGVEGPAALLSDASLCHELLGPPTVSSPELLEMVATWIEAGGESLNKPTHFEVSDGKF